MPDPKHPSQGASEGRPETPPDVSDEELARGGEGKLFADDGRKVRDVARVGAMSPDTDATDEEPARPARPLPRRRPRIVP